MVSLSCRSEKIKTVSLSGNLAPRLIWICCFQWWCSLFQFLIENTFLGKFGLKNQIVSLSWKLVFRLIRILRVEEFSRDVHLFLFSIGSMLFRKFVPKIKIVCWSWNLESRLNWICRIRWSENSKESV